jgi:mono/diheme cytochrome c family protein
MPSYRAFVLSLAAMFVACSPAPVREAATTSAAPAPVTPVQRGQYLVATMGCDDCHTPFKLGERGPEPDMSRRLSGHPAELVMPEPPDLGHGPWMWVGAVTNTAFAGPWGLSYAANLTPSPSGLSAWTEETFVESIRTGRHWGTSRPILPPMPWPAFSRMTDEDLRAVFAYLQSLAPIDNQVPDAVVAGPPPAATE